MTKKETIHKRRKIGTKCPKDKNGKIDIDKLSNWELSYAIKNRLIKWQDIKKWSEQKDSKT